MQTFAAFIVSLLASSGLVGAMPTANSDTLSIAAKRNANFEANGPLALAKAYQKFDKPLPTDLKNALNRLGLLTKRGDETGSVVATPQDNDIEYLCPVQVGTPPQTLQLDFDTGSSDLWVFSSETPSSQSNGHDTYKPGSSSTSKQLTGETWSIAYGDGSTSSGDVYSDVVTIGGLTVQNQAVEAAKTVSSSFSSGPSDGLVGLAFSKINQVKPDQQQTFFDNAKANLKAPVFTADLKHQQDGKYNFGYIDDAAYTGSLTYTPVNNTQGFWGFTSTGYGVGDGNVGSQALSGIADTGTTLLLLPSAVVSAYYEQVNGAYYDILNGGYTFDCKATLPSFTFGIEGSSITIPGALLNYAETDVLFGLLGKRCFGGIQSSDQIGINIFGDIALKSAFVVFDGGKDQLGWAQK